MARIWLATYDKEFREAMEHKTINLRGRMIEKPTERHIVDMLRADDRVKKSREFGIFFACPRCMPIRLMYNNQEINIY